MGRRKKTADSNTGVEGVHVFDTAELDSFMDRLDDKSGAQQKAGMAVANEYRMAEKAGLNRWALGVIRKLEAMERGVMLTALAHFDKYRTHRLTDRESDLFEETPPKDAMVSPPDPADDDAAEEPSETDPGADADEGEPAPAAQEAVSDKPTMDHDDMTMRAGAAARASGQPRDANSQRPGTAKHKRWDIGWQIQDDEILASGRPAMPVKAPTAEHATVQ